MATDPKCNMAVEPRRPPGELNDQMYRLLCSLQSRLCGCHSRYGAKVHDGG